MTGPSTPGGWLAVDGGQSAIRVRLHDGRAGTGSGVRHAPGGVVPASLAGLAGALLDAGWRHGESVGLAVLGMSGLPTDPGQVADLARGVRDLVGPAELLLTGDHVTTHAAATGGRPGVAATVGSGAAVLGLGPDGVLRRVDGWGYVLGDAGSGFAIGAAGLRAALAAHDGRGAPTSLVARAQARFGPVDDVARVVYAAPDLVDVVAQFAVAVLAEAAAGDPVAVTVVEHAADDLARSLVAAAPPGAGAAPGSGVDAYLAGGLVRAGAVLLEPLRRALAHHAPGARLHVGDRPAIDGATWLADLGHPGPYAAECQVLPAPAATPPPTPPAPPPTTPRPAATTAAGTRTTERAEHHV